MRIIHPSCGNVEVVVVSLYGHKRGTMIYVLVALLALVGVFAFVVWSLSKDMEHY